MRDKASPVCPTGLPALPETKYSVLKTYTGHLLLKSSGWGGANSQEVVEAETTTSSCSPASLTESREQDERVLTQYLFHSKSSR